MAVRKTIPLFKIRAILKKHGAKCAICGVEGNLNYDKFNTPVKACIKHKAMEFDHIKPLSRGGCDDIDNFQILCPTCNRKKGNKCQ